MPTYRYKAKNFQAEEIQGIQTADNLDDLKIKIYQEGFFITSTRDIKKSTVFEIEDILGKINAKNFAIFCKKFSVIINSGINITEALMILRDQTPKKKFSTILNEVYEEVQKGKLLSQSLKNHREIFPEFFVSMIEIGEASGCLDEVLMRLASTYEKDYKIKKKIKGASVYPAMILTIAAAVVTLLMIKVVPMFAEMLTSMGGNLPYITILVMKISDFTKNNILWIIGFYFLLISGSIFYYRTEKGRYFFDFLKLKLPIISNLTIKSITAKFARSMATLLKSGVPIIQAVEIIGELIGNRVVEEQFKVCRDDIKEGKGIAASLKKIDIFPQMLFHMISVGEKTGELDDMLASTSELFEEEVEDAIEHMITMIEPIMIVGLAVVVGTIMLSVMLPMAEILNTVSK